MRRVRVISGLLIALAANGALAQSATPLRITAIRRMDVARLVAGETTKDRAASESAQFEILGPPGANVQLIFELPSELSGDQGAHVPLQFTSRSASWSPTASELDLVLFDPRTPTQFTIPATGRALVSVEAVSAPPRMARSGTYQAQITLLAKVQ